MPTQPTDATAGTADQVNVARAIASVSSRISIRAETYGERLLARNGVPRRCQLFLDVRVNIFPGWACQPSLSGLLPTNPLVSTG